MPLEEEHLSRRVDLTELAVKEHEKLFEEVEDKIKGIKNEVAELKKEVTTMNATFVGFQASLSTDISWLKTIVLGTLSASIASVVGMVFQFLKSR